MTQFAKISLIHFFTLVLLCNLIIGCSGGTNGDGSTLPEIESPSGIVGDDAPSTEEFDPLADIATYEVLVQNFWSESRFPQGYPEDAHLSFFGGAVHNQAVSFWSFGEPPSPGIEDMAETGRIDILLAEVAEAIAAGTADSAIDIRVYTDPPTENGPGELTFAVTVKRNYPLVTLTSMLGPSPDWFVGVDGLTLANDGVWLTSLEVDLALYDGGSKSNITPVMHGPGIFPPNPIGFVAYDDEKGVYLPSEQPQYVAKLTFTRSE